MRSYFILFITAISFAHVHNSKLLLNVSVDEEDDDDDDDVKLTC